MRSILTGIMVTPVKDSSTTPVFSAVERVKPYGPVMTSVFYTYTPQESDEPPHTIGKLALWGVSLLLFPLTLTAFAICALVDFCQEDADHKALRIAFARCGDLLEASDEEIIEKAPTIFDKSYQKKHPETLDIINGLNSLEAVKTLRESLARQLLEF